MKGAQIVFKSCLVLFSQQKLTLRFGRCVSLPVTTRFFLRETILLPMLQSAKPEIILLKQFELKRFYKICKNIFIVGRAGGGELFVLRNDFRYFLFS